MQFWHWDLFFQRIIYVRNPITGSLPVYRPSTLYTSRYYDPYYISRVYYPSYLDYTPTYLRSLLPATRSYYYSHLSLYPSERWLDLSLCPSWRHTHYARVSISAIDTETSPHEILPKKKKDFFSHFGSHVIFCSVSFKQHAAHHLVHWPMINRRHY